MPARYFIKLLLIPIISLLLALPCYADMTEEVQKYNEEGKKYVESADFENAIKSFKEAIRLKPDYADAYNNLGVTYHRLGQHEKALKSYQDAIKIDANHFKAYYNSGLVYFDLKQNDKAIEFFKKAIEIYPDLIDAYYFLGIIHAGIKQYEEAIKSFKEVVRLKPTEAEAHYRLGLAYSSLKEYEKAIESYTETIKLKPDYVDAYYFLSLIYHDLRQYEKAIEAFKEAIRIKPDFIDAHYLLGVSYFLLNNYEEAIASYKKVIRLNPDYAAAHQDIGISYFLLGKFAEAIVHQKIALNIYQKVFNKEAEALAHFWLGRSYAEIGQYEKAIESFSTSIELKPSFDTYYWLGFVLISLKKFEEAIIPYKEALKLKPDMAIAYNDLGFAYNQLGKYEEAIRFYEEAIKIKPEAFIAYFNLGDTYTQLHQYEKAIDSYKEAIRLNPESTEAHHRLGVSYLSIGDYIKAEELFNKAIKLQPNYAPAYQDLGLLYMLHGRFNDALKNLNLALNLSQNANNKLGEAYNLSLIGGLYMNQGKDVYALNYLMKALNIFKEIKYLKGESEVLGLIGKQYAILNDHHTALEYYKRALEIAQKLDDKELILRNLGHLSFSSFAFANTYSENYDDAIKYGKQAIEIAEKAGLGNNLSIYQAYLGLGYAYWFLKDYNTALSYGKQWIKLLGELEETIPFKIPLKFYFAITYSIMGRAYAQLENYDLALDYLQKAVKLFNELEEFDKFSKGLALWELGRINDKLGNLSNAKSYYFDAINTFEVSRESTQSLSAKISMAEDASGVYNDTILFLLKSGEEEEAFNYTERAKARTFLDLLGIRFKLQDKEVFEEERRLQFRINYLSEKIREANEQPDKKVSPLMGASLEKQLSEARAEYTALLERIKKENPELSTLLTVNPLTLKEIQGLLDNDTTLLEYFITPKKTLLWIVGKSDLKVVEIAIKDKGLKEKVDLFREKIANLQPDYKKDADELYELLIKPAKQYIKTKRIGIVPHSVLHYLPFHALLNKDKFLIEEYEMFYTPSASVLKFVYEKRKEVKGKVLAFGNPEIGDEKLNLPYAEDEVKKIKATYPETTLYLKEKATEDKAKKLSSDYNIIHFASHGELNPTNPMLSSIRLAKDKDEDGRLEVNEIFNLNLKNTSLVTLSACETGLGKLTQGDELVGLTRGFIYAGTPSIVASLWKVNDQSTSEIMALFYKNLKSHPKSEALRMAQLEMIRGKTGKGIVRGVGGITTSKEGKSRQDTPQTVDGSHPYFWAPFVLLGDWQ